MSDMLLEKLESVIHPLEEETKHNS